MQGAVSEMRTWQKSGRILRSECNSYRQLSPYSHRQTNTTGHIEFVGLVDCEIRLNSINTNQLDSYGKPYWIRLIFLYEQFYSTFSLCEWTLIRICGYRKSEMLGYSYQQSKYMYVRSTYEQTGGR